ncbi:uncharacterized protein [Dysidea avara]|uniref:uncharacterized protein n=1 Tax=Dysidea avara TaxID=196820 RepID=UPI00331E3E7D
MEMENGFDDECQEEQVEDIQLQEAEVKTKPPMLKMCQSCNCKCHIRHSDCPTCHAPFTKKRDMPKTPSELERKYPSNIWSQILKKAQQLHHSGGYDVLILAHKPNPQRGFVPEYCTPGAASNFMLNYTDLVGNLWKQHILNYYAGQSKSPVSSAATLTSANSSAATLTSANSSATLTSANSSAATLTSDNSSAATLTSANSSAATLTSANSSVATLTSANSSAATLTSDNSSAATLTSANSSAATLTSANSSVATLTSANSSAATLTLANSSELLPKKRRRRCGHCDGCKAIKCGTCKFCTKPSLKRPCINKKCKKLA